VRCTASPPRRLRAARSGFVGSPYDLVITGGRVVGKVAQGVTAEILDEATTPAPTNDARIALLGPTDLTEALRIGREEGCRSSSTT
jgi:hypothetical protein